MPEKRMKCDREFKDGAVRLVLDTGRPIAEVSREIQVHPGTLGNWLDKAREAERPDGLGLSEREELLKLRREVHELRMQRDVLKRSVVLWVDEAMGRRP
ncbi:MAG: transposase [Acidimicrobiales bacterium]